MKSTNFELKDIELEEVNGGLIPPYPPSAKAESPFLTTFDGNSKTVNLNTDLDKRTTEIDAPGVDIYSAPEV